MELIFATGNAGKLREMRDICDVLGREYGISLKILPMPEKVDIPETGNTYSENSLQKAQYVWDRWHCNSIADDSGLEVEALGGGPGIYTARYCDRNFKNGIDKLLHELDVLGADTPARRCASFECGITLILEGVPHYFHGHCPGHIHTQRRGSEGFGYDPVFIPDSTPGLCMAELDEAVKNRISHRGLAIEKMFGWLSDHPNILR